MIADFGKAITDFDEAIRLNPKDPLFFESRGGTWSLKGEYDKAIADFTEFIRLDPRSADAYMDRGRAWAAKGDREKAASDYRQAELLRKAP